MHLREVHMENFKSFDRKLTVPFEPGFTGITGPNGSGKSNIGDAILFVLGPNTPRAIRAGKLTDLIFNGGKDGKGAEGCSVSLVFDNVDRTMPVDADTVTLTRRIKRAPTDENPEGCHSYFYVNGRASQKKEFVDLLNHARISADGYNLVKQDDVKLICTMPPQKRREILDDIAGVTTFDGDIRQADARKAEVQANLERIGVVLSEVARTIAQLEKEKGAAQRHRELSQAIARLKGQLAWRRSEDLKQQLAAVQQQAERYAAEHAGFERTLVELREQQKRLEQSYAECQQKIRDSGGEEVQKIQESLQKARDAMVRLEEQANFAQGQLHIMAEQAAPIDDEVRRIAKELERTRKAHAAMAEAADKAAAELEARKKELDAVREVIAKGDAGAMQLNRELAALKLEHEERQTALHQARLEADRLEERRRAVEKAEAEATQGLELCGKDLEETSWQLKEARQSATGAGKGRKDKEKRLFELRKEQAELSRQSEELEQRIRRLQREAAELRAAQEAAEKVQGGMGRAVEEVLAARDSRSIKGIVGTITELGKVDPKHQNAMQIAAAGRLNAVVVEDDAAAAACIEMLKRTGSGRATFLPLSKMVPGRPRGQALMKVKSEGCLGFALDLIQFNPRYQNAFFHVFGDTLVADTMVSGRRMMGGVRIVTLDGELFEASGAMTGGRQGKKDKEEGPTFSGVDRGRLDELLVDIAQSEQAQQGALERLATVRTELEALQTELAAEAAAGGSVEDRLKELERREEALKERARQLKEEVAALGKDLAAVTKEAAAVAKAVAEHAARLEGMEKERQQKGQLLLKGTRKDLKEKVEALEAAIREATEAMLRAQNGRDTAATQLQLVEAAQKEKAGQGSARQAEREKLEADLKRFRKAHEKAKAEVEAILKMEKKATGAVKGLQEEQQRIYQGLVDLKAKIDKVADQREARFGLIQTAKAKLPTIEEALGEALVELQESGVTVAPGEDVPGVDDLKRELRNASEALDRLGPVNMRALEEHDAQSARHAELSGEVARLEGQREELSNLVAEISRKKKDALMEVFTSIKDGFESAYAHLSGGGQGYMELENPEDPFQGGLILRAQPAGKKVLRLEALSGGEQALASMAFIFAIQRFDPSPFYYLDEVDAGLDAVNSEILAKTIEDNARFAQFIMVSHRKITLKEASHVYGVTQSRPGHSEIIARFDVDTLPDKPSAGGGDGDGGAKAGDDDWDPDPTAVTTAPQRKARKAKTVQKTQEKTLADVAAGFAVEVKP